MVARPAFDHLAQILRVMVHVPGTQTDAEPRLVGHTLPHVILRLC